MVSWNNRLKVFLLILAILMTLLLLLKPFIGSVADKGTSILFVLFFFTLIGEIFTGATARGLEDVESPNPIFKVRGVVQILLGMLALIMMLLACGSLSRIF